MIKFEQNGPAKRNHLPNDPWEAAYIRFETPEQEVRKFIGRLKFMDAMKWRRNAKIVELFCGRGSGLRALHQLGFNQVEGIDLSRSLIAEYMEDQAKSWSGIAGDSHLRVPAKISLSCKAVSTTCLCFPTISIEYLRKGCAC
jgi:2-polyprenyl-3-methyl-5-hydroxy-6-metoxy-1,4-benzoquinol methylase